MGCLTLGTSMGLNVKHVELKAPAEGAGVRAHGAEARAAGGTGIRADGGTGIRAAGGAGCARARAAWVRAGTAPRRAWTWCLAHAPDGKNPRCDASTATAGAFRARRSSTGAAAARD